MSDLNKGLSCVILFVVLISVILLNSGYKNTGKYSDMSEATKLTINVNDLEVHNQVLYLAGIKVEVDPNVNIEELVYIKEEITVRVADNNRIAVISGDNGNF